MTTDGKPIRVVTVNDYSYLVLGDDDPHTGRKLLPAEVDRWGGTQYGHWVRRNGKWESRDGEFSPLPQDARIGVLFGGCLDKDGQPVRHTPEATT